MVARGSHIDHADVLGHRVMAPSTLGTFLRSLTVDHVRQLEAVVGKVLSRAWAAGCWAGQRSSGGRRRLHHL